MKSNKVGTVLLSLGLGIGFVFAVGNYSSSMASPTTKVNSSTYRSEVYQPQYSQNILKGDMLFVTIKHVEKSGRIQGYSIKSSKTRIFSKYRNIS